MTDFHPHLPQGAACASPQDLARITRRNTLAQTMGAQAAKVTANTRQSSQGARDLAGAGHAPAPAFSSRETRLAPGCWMIPGAIAGAALWTAAIFALVALLEWLN